ncbi:MAG TPA: DNA-3-methyladenine glycosylase 2 family protein [Blastocatellia bacterium]|nr:DNA-3-methyladenine glycosylase 2 family protein [Blastocatellia bacterium]
MKILQNVLTDRTLKRGLKHLSSVDPDLGQVIKQIGPPPMWERDPGFPTLVHIILEQQVSLASARAAFNKLQAAARPLTPERFLEFDDAELKEIGFSRQKAAYCRSLAQSILDGEFDLARLHEKDDSEARSEMIKIKGIGPWTADIYLLMALRRPNIWPGGDLALVVAIQKIKKLNSRPTPQEFQALGEKWHPWRAVAARILWHYYLSKPASAK